MREPGYAQSQFLAELAMSNAMYGEGERGGREPETIVADGRPTIQTGTTEKRCMNAYNAIIKVGLDRPTFQREKELDHLEAGDKQCGDVTYGEKIFKQDGGIMSSSHLRTVGCHDNDMALGMNLKTAISVREDRPAKSFCSYFECGLGMAMWHYNTLMKKKAEKEGGELACGSEIKTGKVVEFYDKYQLYR